MIRSDFSECYKSFVKVPAPQNGENIEQRTGGLQTRTRQFPARTQEISRPERVSEGVLALLANFLPPPVPVLVFCKTWWQLACSGLTQLHWTDTAQTKAARHKEVITARKLHDLSYNKYTENQT